MGIFASSTADADEIKQGMVAFLDVLGYQHIINNNEIRTSAKIVSNIFEKLPSMVKGSLTGPSPRDRNAIDAVRPRLISDSILLTLDDPNPPRGDECLLFLIYTSRLMRLAFDEGLPLRGAISHGEFFLSGQCFAGKPIVDCYAQGHSLQMSGCVLTPEAEAQVQGILAENPGMKEFFDPILLNYLTPLKGDITRKLPAINWLRPFEDWGIDPADIRQYVADAFFKHNKDIDPDAADKLANTELFLRRVRGLSHIVSP